MSIKCPIKEVKRSLLLQLQFSTLTKPPKFPTHCYFSLYLISCGYFPLLSFAK